MAFGFKHKIAALLVPIVGASIINLPTVASAMEKSDISTNFSESTWTAGLDQSHTLTGVALDANETPVSDQSGVSNFTTGRSEASADDGSIDLFWQPGGITSLNTVAENKAVSGQVNPESLDVNLIPGTITIGGTTTIEVTLNFANGTPENLPESIQITIDGSPVQVMRRGKTNVYSTTYTPTTTGLKTIGATFGNASGFAALDVTEKNNPPSGGLSSNMWKIVAGVLGVLGLIGALIAGALNFLPRAFKF